MDESWRRIDFFPKTFNRPRLKPRIHRTQRINLDPETLSGLKNYKISLDTLFTLDDRFDFLRQRDVVGVDGLGERFLEVRHIYKGPFAQYLNRQSDQYNIRHAAKRQIGREVDGEDPVTVLEVESTFIPNEP